MEKKFLALLIVVMSISILTGAPPNNDFIVAAGTTYNGDIQTTDQDVIILIGATVDGDVETTSGDIYLEENARVEEKVSTSSGNVYLDVGSRVDKTIDTQSGTIRVRQNATVNGNVTTEYGDIKGEGAIFNKNVKTRHGHISLKAGTYVDGDVSILDRGHGSGLPLVEIYLGEGVYIDGKVTASHVGDNVDLSMWQAEVNGQIDKVNVVGGDDGEDEEDEEGQGGDCGGRPEWSNSVQYHTNDEVHKDGNAYQAKKASKKKDPTIAKNSKYWTNLGGC
jgi:hypothetical protein